MATVDIIIIGVIVLSSLISLVRGFVKEAFSLGTWMVASWASLFYSKNVVEYLSPYIQTPSLQKAASFACIFIAILIIGGIANYIVSTMVTKTGLSGTDKMIGVAFGGVRGLLIVTVLVMILGFFPVTEDAWYKSSKLIPHFIATADMVKQNLPPELAEYFKFLK